MNYKEAAGQLGYTYAHVTRLVKTGKLGRKFETGYEITQDDIDKWIANPPKQGLSGKIPYTGKELVKMRGKKTMRQFAAELGVTPAAVYRKIAKDK